FKRISILCIIYVLLRVSRFRDQRDLYSFPTRRSSDLKIEEGSIPAVRYAQITLRLSVRYGPWQETSGQECPFGQRGNWPSSRLSLCSILPGWQGYRTQTLNL